MSVIPAPDPEAPPRTSTPPPAGLSGSRRLPFYGISTFKLAAVSIPSLGLYTWIWLYRNWRAVAARSEVTIRPFWRTLFAPIYIWALFWEVGHQAERLGVRPAIRPIFWAGPFLGLSLASYCPWPWFLLGALLCLPALPVARTIEKVHRRLDPGAQVDRQLRLRTALALLLGGVLISYTVVLRNTPSTLALRGPEVSNGTYSELIDAGFLDPSESVVYFYSDGVFSLFEDGNILTDRRVISYAEHPDGFYYDSVPYSQIVAIDVEYSDTVFSNTRVQILTLDARIIMLVVSSAKERDRDFVRQLRSRWRRHLEEPATPSPLPAPGESPSLRPSPSDPQQASA